VDETGHHKQHIPVFLKLSSHSDISSLLAIARRIKSSSFVDKATYFLQPALPCHCSGMELHAWQWCQLTPMNFGNHFFNRILEILH
jgi:hypothetical protein